MNIFGWKSAGREATRPALSARAGWNAFEGSGAFGGGGGLALDTLPRSYEAQVREGYLGNAIAQRSVRLLAEGVGEAPLDGVEEAVALVSARSSGQPLLATLAAHVLLHGNAYVQIVGDERGAAAELFALRPERVTVELDASGWPAAYRYRVGTRSVQFSAEGPRPQVAHIKAFHPLDDHYGLGCLSAAARPIALHNAAATWNTGLLENAARPSGALVYDPGDGSTLSREQFERLRTEMEAGFAGARNAGRPMLLEGGLKWQALSLSPADMDFAGMKATAAREIATAFGVPPMLLGLPGDATYANYREANRAVWRQSILPLAGTILTSINQALAGWMETASALRVSLDRVTALAEDRALLWDKVGAADFLTHDEKRALLGLEPGAGQGPGA